MKYSIYAVLAVAVIGLSACSSVPGGLHDVGATGSSVVNGSAGVVTTALDGASNLVMNIANDLTNGIRAVMPPVPPPARY